MSQLSTVQAELHFNGQLKLQAVLRALAVACNLPPMQVGLLRFVNEAIPRQEKVLMTDLSVPIKGAKLCS